AEDGIRDATVTGVQTCALPISLLINNITLTFGAATLKPGRGFRDIYTTANTDCPPNLGEFCTPDKVNINPSKLLFNLFGQVKFRSEERRVGRECRCGWLSAW